MLSNTNTAFLRVSKRAEQYDNTQIVNTFVDIGALFVILSNTEHQILYGRRGTGKTHALSFLGNAVKSKDDIAFTIDMRTIGSSGGIYADPESSVPERATKLLVDTLAQIHESILQFALENDDKIDLSTIGTLLDAFAESATEVRIEGEVGTEEFIKKSGKVESSTEGSLKVGTGLPSLAFAAKGLSVDESEHAQKNIKTGTEHFRINFGSVQNCFSRLSSYLSPRRIWILLDEWSEVPLDLQPYLADLFRRCVFPVRGVTVKIAAIEQRCMFRMQNGQSNIGIELGADASSLSLDEFMVFENDPEKAVMFFENLLFKHYQAVAVEEDDAIIEKSEELISKSFTQREVFHELVKASEGVPRDAINILSLGAQKAEEQKITMSDIRNAARTWYTREKERAINIRPEAAKLLHWIIDDVIRHRRARAFLLETSVQHPLIDFLFDARILHIIKRSISGHDQPGIRYNAYCIDYGCYVDLIATTRAPLGLFEVEVDEELVFVDVPSNDYRAIRRAILDLIEFEQQMH